MQQHPDKTQFDVIVVGSGPCGATVAKDLSRRGKSVLVLERGGDRPLKEGLSMATILDAVAATEDRRAVRAFTTGGTTAVWFAVADYPPLEVFRGLGIDLSRELEEAKKELPLAVLPDRLYGAQAKRLESSAVDLGYTWNRALMMVDVDKCASGYRYEAKWNARLFLDEAVKHGTRVVSGARVSRVLIEDGRAIGVEYNLRLGKKKFEVRRAFGAKVILAAGGAESPIILRDSGVKGIASAGFYCHPSLAIFATVPGLKSGDNFIGNMGTVLDGDIGVGDANPARNFYRMFMLGNRRFFRAFRHSTSIGVGVMVKEGLGGTLGEDGRYRKEIEKEDQKKLEKGKDVALKILQRAGGKNIFEATPSAAHIGGALQIRQHIDPSLETECRDLHVCDGSVIPADVKVTPTLTLICLAKYLANCLSPVKPLKELETKM